MIALAIFLALGGAFFSFIVGLGVGAGIARRKMLEDEHKGFQHLFINKDVGDA